ncbi:hypothetical protein I7I53_01091 [Histoplasma capsulatum var. duboisii H88]|uniref:Uncharacterized protein n=1 Tax=Ajellomyces capsulatus (strain H88) TaxID=544711 RepID=A0A8A1LH94_AJEC8|nr:hypothetical protein I7I53_01091 [Histoplasma capsulatum var. duboisii H88]
MLNRFISMAPTGILLFPKIPSFLFVDQLLNLRGSTLKFAVHSTTHALHPPLAQTFRVKSHPSCASICPHKDRLKLHSKPGSFVTIRCCYRLKIRQ